MATGIARGSVEQQGARGACRRLYSVAREASCIAQTRGLDLLAERAALSQTGLSTGGLAEDVAAGAAKNHSLSL